MKLTNNQKTAKMYLLEDKANYFPVNYPKMDPDEKINWLEKELPEFTNSYSKMLQQNVYGNFPVINLNLTNGNASVPWKHPKLEGTKPREFNTYNITMNARLNTPIYSVSTRATNSETHAIKAILVGDNPKNFNDWIFYEPQSNEKVIPGDFSMDPNEFANIDRYSCTYDKGLQQHMHGNLDVINFNLTDAKFNLDFYGSGDVSQDNIDPKKGDEN